VKVVFARTEIKSALAEVELVFEGSEPLAGLRLVGFAVRKDPKGVLYVTLPGRAFGIGEKRQYFDYLRGESEHNHTEDVRWIKDLILDAWKHEQA